MDSENDEMDLFGVEDGVILDTPTICSSQASDASPDYSQAPRRSSRKPVPVRKEISTLVTYERKRKRPSATRGNDVAKKARLEEQKAATGIVNDLRDTRDKVRRRWFYCHRGLVEPLLPLNSGFYDQLHRELGASNKATFVPHRELYEQPKSVVGSMKDYQLSGLSFLVYMYRNGMNCILGDEMGLGKTLQTLSLFAYIKEDSTGFHPPHLVICPLSVLSSWVSEAARWVPSLRCVKFHGNDSERQRLKDSLRADRNFDIMFTTYEVYVAEDTWFKSNRWMYCVLDEGHRIKNSDTNLANKLQALGSLYRLILSGTPVQNNLVELWSLLHWLYPFVFTQATEHRFKDSFDLTRGSYELSFLNSAKKLLSTIMLRRTKSVVTQDVPPREELTVFIPLTEMQRFWTYRLLTRMDAPDLKKIFSGNIKNESLDEDLPADLRDPREVLSNLDNQPDIEQSRGNTGKVLQWKKLMNLLLQLRKVCDHPYTLPNAEPEPYDVAEHVITASSKLIAIDKILADILPKGEKVLIFSQFTNMLDILEDFLTLRSISYARLDGQTPRARRALDIRLFQQEFSPYKVYLVSTKAGGLGINLTRATTVIMCEPDWNPQNELQAIARAHRIGQTKVVKVYRLICQGSVEDQMLDRLRRKLFLSVKIMGSDNPDTSQNTTMGQNELVNILRMGSSVLSESCPGMNIEEFAKASMEEILENSRSLEGARDAKIKKELNIDIEGKRESDDQVRNAEEEERRLLAGVAQVQSRLFEGKVIDKKRKSNNEIAQEWVDMKKRAKVDPIVVIDDVASVSPEPLEKPKVIESSAKKRGKKFDSSDWCIHCRDGGELFLCSRCPRVFHAECRGIPVAALRKDSLPTCTQHVCTVCDRTTAEAGGMLFRCRTCPDAFCEDCLPPGDIDAVGETLPEFRVLGYGKQSTAFYINCQDCRTDRARRSSAQFWLDWETEFRSAEKILAAEE